MENKGRAINWELDPKQEEAFLTLVEDNGIDEVLFGGGAGGGKTHFGCSYSLMLAIKYKDVRIMIGRETWEDLKNSTLLTFKAVLKQWGLRKNIDYSYNGQDKVFTFTKSGSQVYFKYLRLDNDPDGDRFGSTEYTFAFIDEAQEVALKAKNILKSRLRYNLEKYGLKPKILLTCNPTNGWLKSEFYIPWRDNKLPENKMFIQSLAKDNSYIDKNYIKLLSSNDDKAIVERLLFGNWDYNNDPRLMIEYDNILELWETILDEKPEDESFIICDLARLGKDSTTISAWKGLKLIKGRTFRKQRVNETEKIIREWKQEFRTPLKNILIDEVGVGGGLVDNLKCSGFIANASAQENPLTKKKENYASLKAQCAYRLAKAVNNYEIEIPPEVVNLEDKQTIIEELSILKTSNKEDRPLDINSKEEMKLLLKRSPDWLDNFIMRFYYSNQKKKGVFAVWI